MIKRIQMNINYSNQGKLEVLDKIMNESKRVIQEYVDILWTQNNFSSKFIDFKIDSWLSARMLQCLGKQSLEIVKSQRKRKKKIKPIFNSNVINFDSRFIDIQFDNNNNSFDVWIKINSIGNRICLKLPSQKHKHFNKLISNDWKLKKSCRLKKRLDNQWFIDFYVEKEQPELKKTGNSIGIDIGYKKLIITSNNEILDEGMEEIYEKISRRKQGSKSFKKSLIERDNKINESLNKLNVSNIRKIVVENLKNVKKNSKGKIRKQFNNKLQRWSYPKVLSKIQQICVDNGIEYVRVNPCYTSQTCSACGFKDKKNRSGERFKCLNCEMEMDADLNASINILHRGVYSLSTIE